MKKSTLNKMFLLAKFLKKNKIGINGTNVTVYNYDKSIDNYELDMALGAVPWDKNWR